jgi:hypothetical protein
MTAFTIKLIAIFTMVIDHIGLFFFPDVILLRLIGRISFPLFAWLIANGAYHTHNIPSYLKRLVLCAVISQVPFFLANKHLDPHLSLLNVVFTLSTGLVAIYYVKKTADKRLWVLIAVIAASIAGFTHMDYGAMGVLLLLCSYFFFKRPLLLLCSQILLFLGDFFWNLVVHQFISFEFVGLFSLLFIITYNTKPGPRTRYFFYLFYPLQYVVIYCLQLVL